MNKTRLRGGHDLVEMGGLLKQLRSSTNMIISVLRIGVLGLLAAAIAGMPLPAAAQNTNNPTATKKSPAVKKDSTAKKQVSHPFHGNLAAVDQVAKTIKVGESVYQITSETRFTKDGKPATLADGVVGEPVSGYAKPADDGKMAATKVRFGAKVEEKSGEKKKAP